MVWTGVAENLNFSFTGQLLVLFLAELTVKCNAISDDIQTCMDFRQSKPFGFQTVSKTFGQNVYEIQTSTSNFRQLCNVWNPNTFVWIADTLWCKSSDFIRTNYCAVLYIIFVWKKTYRFTGHCKMWPMVHDENSFVVYGERHFARFDFERSFNFHLNLKLFALIFRKFTL